MSVPTAKPEAVVYCDVPGEPQAFEQAPKTSDRNFSHS